MFDFIPLDAEDTQISLLENAAKAIRKELRFGYGSMPIMDNKHWNPLDDDGDAARLRNRIGATVMDEGSLVCVSIYRYGIPSIEIREPYERDLPEGYSSPESVDKAVRLAIVHAASELGMAMESALEQN